MLARRITLLFAMIFIGSEAGANCPAGTYGLVVHGGAGSWAVTEPQKKEYEILIKSVLAEGRESLANGASSLNVVQTAVQRMEDSGRLNAGKGAVRNKEKVVELDASIMDGATLRAGAVGGVKDLKNPVLAARLVMDKTWHVLLVAEGASKFASAEGATLVDPSYFTSPIGDRNESERGDNKYGTVGAVALDCQRNLAAATSTGGLRKKLPGRLGDSPIIGAGTYAKNATCAVSGTGEGEYFIRDSAAFGVSAQMELAGATLAEATRAVVETIASHGGSGGVIAIDRRGNIAMPYNTKGMLRGFVTESSDPTVMF